MGIMMMYAIVILSPAFIHGEYIPVLIYFTGLRVQGFRNYISG